MWANVICYVIRWKILLQHPAHYLNNLGVNLIASFVLTFVMLTSLVESQNICPLFISTIWYIVHEYPFPVILFNSFIRNILEYASVMWNTTIVTTTACSLFSKKNLPCTSYPNRLVFLNMISPQHRRTSLDASKLYNGLRDCLLTAERQYDRYIKSKPIYWCTKL